MVPGVETILFSFCLLDSGSVLFLSIYTLVTLSDLECDHINPSECAVKLNAWVIPELLGSAALTVLLLVTGHWALFGVHVVMTTWLSLRLYTVPKGNVGIFDPTDLHSRIVLRDHMKSCIFRTIVYLFSFLVFLYCFIISVIRNQ